MFKIKWMRDLFNNDPTKRKKIKGLSITIGYRCSDACWCDCASKCKYRKGFGFHNFSVRLHDFFQYRLHIKLPHFLYVDKESNHLSGTEMCPYQKSRRYTCWDCKYSLGNGCGNKQYRDSTWEESHDFEDPEWHNTGKCKFFEKDEFADNYDRKTGEIIYD